MKVRRKFNVKESGIEVYIDMPNLVGVSREESGDLCFESNNRYLSHFLSYDIGESVSAFMKIRSLDPRFWDLKVNDRHYDVDAEKCLYWLSGGDSSWNADGKYRLSWRECSQLFADKYAHLIYDIIDESVTLNDIKRGFKANFNLNLFYEFALENDLIK